MFILSAPYPAEASTILLPNPKTGNNLGLATSVTIIKMEDGSSYAYKRAGGGERTHRWDFIIAHDKMLELTNFFSRYAGVKMRTQWRGRTIIGKVSANPVEAIGDRRAGGWPGNEAYSVTIELREE